MSWWDPIVNVATAPLKAIGAIGGAGRAGSYSDQQAINGTDRSQVDNAINQYLHNLSTGGPVASPEQFAQSLSNNGAHVSYQEIMSRVGQGAGGEQPGGSFTGVSAPYAGGGAAGGPDVGALRGQVLGMRGGLDQLFNQIYGGINTQAAQQQQDAQNNYNTSQQSLTNNYLANNNQNDAAYTARNAYDSSFRANAGDTIKNDFNTQTTANQNALNKNMANVGQYISQARAGLDASRPDWNAISNDQNATDLGTYYNQLGQLSGSLKSQLAGLGSNSDYQNLAKSVAPYTSAQSQGVVDQLQKLAGTAGSPGTQQTAANGFISQLPDQNTQSYWQNYFANLTKQQQAQ